MDLKDKKIGFAMCGSFCTFKKAMAAARSVKLCGADIFPIMSETSYSTDTRFGTAEAFRNELTSIAGHEIISTVKDAEPLGPKAPLDILAIVPCTGNTLAKLADGIADSSVTLAAKAHLRNCRPIVIAVSTNDGLGAAAQNIGKLLARKHIYFVPFGQDKRTGYLIQFNNLYLWCILVQVFHRKIKMYRNAFK